MNSVYLEVMEMDFKHYAYRVRLIASWLCSAASPRDSLQLRVIFDNHTASNLLLRSLSRSLYPDGNAPVGRRLIIKEDGPLFGNAAEADDVESGTIYVLRSLSSYPVKPRGWSRLPPHVIDQAVQRIRDGSISGLAPPRRLKPPQNADCSAGKNAVYIFSFFTD